MPSCELVKTGKGDLIGFSQDDHKVWEKFKRWWKDLEPGEFFTLTYKQPRNPVFHRKFMKMVRFAFEQWEPEKARKRMTYKGLPIHKDFEQFRKDMTILAGYGIAKFDARGRVTMDAVSLSFDKMDEDTFEKVYRAMYEVLYEHIFRAKGYSREELNRVLEEFERFQPT